MITLDEGKLAELKEILDDSIESFQEDLSGLWQKFELWEKFAEGEPKEKTKSYPHAKAANIAVPATSVALKTMYGALWVALSQRKPLVIVKPLDESNLDKKAQAEALQEYLSVLSKSPQDLGMDEFLRSWLKSSCLYGTGFAKVLFDNRERVVTVEEEDPVSGSRKTVKYTVTDHFGPRVVFIQPTDILFDQAFQDLQRSPVVLERVTLSSHELKSLSKLGYFDPDAVEKVLGSLTESESLKETQTRPYTGTTRSDTTVAELYEAYVMLDIDDDGFSEDLLVVYHPESREILSVEFNSYGERMISTVSYENRPGFIWGIGVGQQTEYMQQVINTLYNSRLDGIALTDAPMFKIKRGSPIPLTDEIYPGKRIPVDSPDDLIPIVFEKSFLNTRQEEFNSITWLQKNTGATDTLAGFPDSVMRTADTVGGQVLRLKQSSAMFTTILANYESALTEIYKKVMRVLVLHKDLVIEHERRVGRLSPDKLDLLEKALSIDPYQIPAQFSFSVNVTDVDETFEAQRQNALTVVQIMTMYFERVIQLAQMVDSKKLGPMAMSVAIAALETATRQMQEILKLFDQEDETGFLPDSRKLAVLRQFAEAFLVKDLQAVQMAMAQAIGPGSQAGGQPGGFTPAPQIPLASETSEFGGVSGAGEPGSPSPEEV